MPQATSTGPAPQAQVTATSPQATAPGPVSPQETAPGPVSPQATAPGPVSPQATAPGPVSPQETAPGPASPQATATSPAVSPQATAPVPVSPRATATGPVVSPQATAPDSVSPQVTDTNTRSISLESTDAGILESPQTADTELSPTEHSLGASNTVRKRIYLPRQKDTVEQHPTDDENNEIVELPTDDEKKEIIQQPTDGEKNEIVEQPTDDEKKEIVEQQPTDGEKNEITFIDTVDSPGCSSRFYHLRYVRSKGAILVLVWNLIVSFSFGNSIKNVAHTFSAGDLDFETLFIMYIILVALQASYPLIGFLTGLCCGKFNVMRWSLWIICIGLAVGTIFLAAEVGLVKEENIEDAGILLITFIAFSMFVFAVGLIPFYTTILSFGMSQMKGPVDSVNEELGSFVNWFVWTQTVGIGVSQVLLTIASSCNDSVSTAVGVLGGVLAVQVIATVALFVTLLLGKVFNKWLEKVGKQNPYKDLYLVLRHVHKTKEPPTEELKAEWKSNKCSRFDVGKQEYGGPFTQQRIEDVKKMGRILIVLLAFGSIFMLNIPASFTLPAFSAHLDSGSPSCSADSVLLGAGTLSTLLLIVIIPVYEFLIHPFFRRFVPGVLVRMGTAAVLLVLAIVYFFILDTVGHSLVSDRGACMFDTEDSDKLDDIDKRLVIPPVLVNSVAYYFIQVAGLEFICSQSPKSLRGILITLFFSTRSFFWVVGLLAVLPFWLPFTQNTFPSCGFYYYILNMLLAVAIIIAYIVLARRYHKQQKEAETKV